MSAIRALFSTEKCSGLTLLDLARKAKTNEALALPQRLDDKDITDIQSFCTQANTNTDVYLSQSEYDLALKALPTLLSDRAKNVVGMAFTMCDGKIAIGE
jgi:hypothetical protein